MGPGTRLGDFLLREKIGEGSFGVVYRAHQASLGRDAVVKVLHAHHVADATARGRFLREARLASRLVHPHAAHIYAFGAEENGAPWIAMELVGGTPLSAHLAEHGPLPLPRVVGLVDQIADVVGAAHEQGIVHRDLKPGNVMVSRRGEGLSAKLLDFGLARLEAVPDAAAPPAAEADAGAATQDPALTREGAYVGSPYYMAPEQWQPGGLVDARSDQYALALLAWECLAGRPPFLGTIVQVGRAHVNKPLPALPQTGEAGLPTGVAEVLARGAAKTKEARFPSVAAFAAALRSAAGLGPELVPPLPEALRQAIALAPQPIAETLAALEVARNLHQALDAVRTAEQALMRYVAGIALAGRSHGAAVAIPEGLASLRQRHFHVEDWLELIADLLRPAGKDFALPELAQLFAAGIPPALAGGLGAESSADAHVGERLTRELDDLAARVAALGFLADYPLVVAGDEGADGAEVWMGPRRLTRAVTAPVGALAPGHPTLLDRQGRVVLDLHPVAQVAAPAPGAAREIFLLAGPGPRGARLVAAPLGVERQDPAVWEWLRASLDESGDAALAETPPWRGLRPYTRDDAAAFYGRDEEIQVLANRLRLERFVAVAGPSGSGKSSLVAAGLVANLGPEWRVLIARPGVDPLGELAALLAREVGLDGPPAAFAARLRATPAALADLVTGEQTLLVIDQLEELFTACHDDLERRAYAAALAAAARTARVVVTVRDDFLGRVNQLPALRELLAASLMLVATPDPADLLRILLEPARRAGYTFDDPELPGAMVANVAERPGALALLSFTASALWERRDRHYRRLLKQAYDDMGGVGGALARHAEETLHAFPAGEQTMVREAFRQLVTAEGTRAVMSRAELAPIVGDELLERLIAARLLASSDESGTDRVEIAHEALLTAWPRLMEWRRDDAGGARLRDQLRAAARTWTERGRPRDVLWRGEALSEYRAWRARAGGRLAPAEEAFAAESVRDAARGRRLRLGAAGSVFTILAVASIFLFVLARRASTSAGVARRRLLDSYVEQGRRFLLAGDPLRGLAFLRQAMREGEGGPMTRFLVARGLAAMAPQRHVLPHGDLLRAVGMTRDGARVMTATRDGRLALWDGAAGARLAGVDTGEKVLIDAALSPDGTLVVSGGRDRGRLWDTRDGSLVRLAHDDKVSRVAWSPDGTRVATASQDATVKLWRAPQGTLLATLRHGGPVLALAFAPDGRRLVAGSAAGEIAVWDVAGGTLVRRLADAGEPVAALALTPDGRRVVAARGRAVEVLDAESGARLAALQHPELVSFVAVSDDGTLLVSGGNDPAARLWDLTHGTLRQVLAHTDAVADARFCGGRLVTASVDHTLRVWRPRSGELMTVLSGHRGSVRRVECDAAGARAVSGGLDLSARIWDLAPPGRLADLDAGAGVVRVSAAADGTLLAAARRDGRIVVWDVGRREKIATLGEEGQELASVMLGGGGRLIAAGPGGASVWDVRAGRRLQHLDAGGDEMLAAELSADGARAVTASRAGTVTVWDLGSGKPLARLTGHSDQANAAAFSPDGRTVVSASNDRSVRLWDPDGRRPPLVLAGHTSWVQSVSFSRDGRRVVSAAADNAVRIWDAPSGALLLATEAHGLGLTGAELSPSGRLVFSATFSVVDTWDGESGRLLDEVRPHEGSVSNLTIVNEDVVATGGDDEGRVALWDVATERRSPGELEDALRCLVPFDIVDGKLRPVEVCLR